MKDGCMGRIFSAISHQPIPTFTKRKIKIFTPIAYQVLSEQASAVTAYPTLSQLLDSYYHEKQRKIGQTTRRRTDSKIEMN